MPIEICKIDTVFSGNVGRQVMEYTVYLYTELVIRWNELKNSINMIRERDIMEIQYNKITQSKILLHLSDIHFGRNKDNNIVGDFLHKEQILDELIRCIVTSEYKIEHIVFTGDIAWHGKENEFEEAYEWFTKLLSELNLSGKDITFCPGNHDVNRNYVNFNRNLETKNIKVIDEIYEYENIFKMETPKENYNKFCEKMGVTPFHYPVKTNFESSYSIGCKDIGDEKSGFRIFSFDTSLLSVLTKVNSDHMFIGQPQVIDLIEGGLFETNRYKIAIFHHAERFLHPNEICEYDDRMATLPLLRDYVDLVLCGHTETGGKPVLYRQSEGAYTLTSGAAYYDDNHPNAFCFLQVDGDRRISLHPFAWSDCKWKAYDYKRKYKIKEQKRRRHLLGTMEGKTEFGVKSKEKGNYTISIHNFSIYNPENGMIKGDNLDDPNRKIDLSFVAPILNRGDAKFSINPPRTCDNSVEAAIQYENFCKYLSEINKTDSNSFGGKNIKANVELQNIEYYKSLTKIEKYFDIRFKRPDRSNQEENMSVNILIDYIDKGCAEIPSLIECGIDFEKDEKVKLEKMIKSECSENIYLICDGLFICELHGAQMEFESIVVSGPYNFDKVDIQKKAETFMAGDKRNVEFRLSSYGKTYLINKENRKSETTISFVEPYDYIIIGNMKLKWLCFTEIETKKEN